MNFMAIDACAMLGSRRILALVALAFGNSAMAIDISPLWDFDRPEVSEQRFRAALPTAQADDRLILQTQIARTYGLRREFARAREILKEVEPQLSTAGAEASVRYALELGRTFSSGAHSAESQTPHAQDLARAQYLRALELARGAQLDDLAVDAVHMLAFVDQTPSDQLHRAQQALAIVEASSQPGAKRWEASLRNNAGYALHQLGRYDEALSQFTQGLALREKGTNAQATLIARWMLAWTLRAMGRTQEALDIQLRLEREWELAGTPSHYVFDELALLYRQKGDAVRADMYAERKKALSK